jgi:hypothetical protein
LYSKADWDLKKDVGDLWTLDLVSQSCIPFQIS